MPVLILLWYLHIAHWTRNKCCMPVIYILFNTQLNSVCWYVIENFCVYGRGMLTCNFLFFFFCRTLLQNWYQGNASFIEWVTKECFCLFMIFCCFFFNKVWEGFMLDFLWINLMPMSIFSLREPRNTWEMCLWSCLWGVTFMTLIDVEDLCLLCMGPVSGLGNLDSPGWHRMLHEGMHSLL